MRKSLLLILNRTKKYLLFSIIVTYTATISVQAAVPLLKSSTPSDGDTGISQAVDLVLRFSQKLTAVSGKNIKLYQSGGSLIESIDATSAQVSITNGDKKVTVDFANALSGGTGYYINIDPGAFTNSGDPYAGISDSTTLNFTTIADTTAPNVTFSPANGATGVAANSNITLTFDESVRHIDNSAIDNTNVDALITLKNTNAAGSNIAFDATISGNIITINPTSNLSSEQVVYVGIGTSVEDDADNAISATSATFTVADTQAPTVTFEPANGETNVPNNVYIEVIFDEVAQLLNGGDITKNNNNADVAALITLKDTDANGADIPFSVVVHTHTYPQIEVYPDSALGDLQQVYLSIAAGLQDTSGNIISATSTSFTAGLAPHYNSTYPRVFQKNIGIDANIVIEFDRVVSSVASNEAATPSARTIKIWNASTYPAVLAQSYNSTDATITGSGTTQITLNPTTDLEERVDYYITIDENAFKDANGSYFPGISDNDSLSFKTAKDPNKYVDVVASNETHVNHSMNQVEKSISTIANRQNFIRRNGGRNNSSQGIKFKFNNERLDETLNKLAPLVKHFEQYDVSTQLANATDKALPSGWGLWTSGEISLGDTNAKNGADRSSNSKEISIGLDKRIDVRRMAGGAYRINRTETKIGSDGTKMDSNTKTWSLYGSLRTTKRNTLEGLVGVGDISTDHTRVDGVNTYTGVRKSKQVFACLIARESHKLEKVNLSPFVRVDSSYTKQDAYSETGDSDTAYDALHYKANNFHNAIISLGLDVDTKYQAGNKSIKPYASLRHKENTGYESSNVMYYLSNPIKEYTQNITSDNNDSGFNLVAGVDIQSEDGWLITGSYELSESELTLNKSIRFRAEWEF